MESHTKISCDMKSFAKIAYNMENDIQITCDLKNFTDFPVIMESHTRSIGDLKNLSTIAYNMANQREFTSDMKKLKVCIPNGKISKNYMWHEKSHKVYIQHGETN